MKVKIYTLTTDGDNMPIETQVFGTEQEARDEVTAILESNGVYRCKDGHKISSASITELGELWEETFDGCCIVDEHEVEVEAQA